MLYDLFEVDELLALARMDADARNWDRALEKLKVAHGRKERSAQVDVMLARLYAQTGLFEKAIQYFSRYLENHPDAELERFQLGMVYFDSRNLSKALELWHGILQKNPIHPPALFYRALAMANLGKVDEARRDLEVLLQSAAVDNLYFGRAKELLERLAVNDKSGKRLKESKDVARNDDVYRVDR